VALDLDGVLLDGMPFHIKAWQLAFERCNYHPDPTELYRLEGIPTREVVEMICEAHSLELSSHQREEISSTKRRIYREVFQPVPLSGANSLLKQLMNWKYPIAVVTGTSRRAAVATLEALEAIDLISAIVSSDDNIPGKPDPAPFREAARQLCVNTTQCLAVDNAPPGVTSAVLAGLPCVGVATYLDQEDLTEADLVFADVQTVANWIDREHEISKGRGPWILKS